MSERDDFTAALQLADPAARAAYLDRTCAGDAPLRLRVELLLRAHGGAGDFLERPAEAPAEANATPVHDVTASLGAERQPEAAPPRAGAGDDEADAPLTFLQPPTMPGSLGRLGHYEVLEVIGKGGFGIVLRAFDELLHRVVAVKVMAPQLAATSPARKRFLREGRSSARVRHDHVVAIYSVEEHPIPYLVMEFIAGETVQQRLDRVGPLDAAEVVRLGRQIAEGLAEAHAMGLTHRDVKPSNILLESGAERVKITDFGLARAADDASVTQSGVIAGTPMYMAPEQAKGESLDHRADLFSLGSVLYVMCSGRPPFRASGALAVLKRVTEDAPRPIREIIPETPPWLCEIIAKLHAKNPDERFQTAQEVADVLTDCEAQLAAHARLTDFSRIPVGKQRRSGRWKWVAAAAVLLPCLALALTEATGLTHLFRGQPLPTDPTQAEGSHTGKKLPRDAVLFPPNLEDLLKRPSPLDGRKRSDIPPDLLARASGGDPDKVPAELVAVLGSEGYFALPRWDSTHEPAVSPDGKWLAVACGKDVAVFDAATGALRRTLTGATQRLVRLAFSPESKRVGAGCLDNKAYLWEIESGKLEQTLNDHPGPVYSLAFSPDGKRMATACSEGSLFLWDADGQNKTPLPRQQGLQVVAFSPDSKYLASAGVATEVVVWDTTTRAEVWTLKGHKTPPITNVRFSPDGKTLASGGDKETILWDLETGQPRHTLAAPACGLLAFTSDGKSLLAARWWEEAGGDYLLTRWDPATGKQLAEVSLGPRRQGMEPLRFYAASADGTTVYACHFDGDDRVTVFDAVTGKERFPHADFHAGPVWAVAVSPDGRTLATGGQDRRVRLWDLVAWKPGERLPPCRVLEGHSGSVRSLVFSPRGEFLASGAGDGVVILWDPAAGKKLRDPFGRIQQTGLPGFSPDGHTLACPQEDGRVILYEMGTPGQVSWQPHKAAARAAAFSPDNKLVASGGHDGKVSVINRADGKTVYVIDVKVPAVSGRVWRGSSTRARLGLAVNVTDD